LGLIAHWSFGAGRHGVLAASAEDLNAVGKHDVVTNIGESDTAKPADIGAIADNGFRH
jgi:hypothetical protein